MSVTAPEWLTKRGGELHSGKEQRAWAVYVNNQPQYVLLTSPAGGKFACQVKQTNNGKRLESGTTYPTLDDAVRGGLEDLRKALGW